MFNHLTAKKKRTLIGWLVFMTFGGLLFGTVALTGWVYIKQESLAKTTPTFWVLSDNSGYNVTTLKNQTNLLSIGIGYNAFDIGKGLKIEMGFNPKNNLTSEHGLPTLPVCVSFGSKDLTFNLNEEMSPENIVVPFSGDSSWYPFDVYVGELFISARVGSATSNGTCVDDLPISPAILGSAQGFVVTAVAKPGFDQNTGTQNADYSTALIYFTARRTKIQTGFSCLIFLVMWLLTSLICSIAFWVWKRGRRTELGLVSISAGLLYALPRLRDLQPGIPKMGIIMDMVGYCWNELLVAFCLLFQLLNYILKRNSEKHLPQPLKEPPMIIIPDCGGPDHSEMDSDPFDDDDSTTTMA